MVPDWKVICMRGTSMGYRSLTLHCMLEAKKRPGLAQDEMNRIAYEFISIQTDELFILTTNRGVFPALCMAVCYSNCCKSAEVMICEQRGVESAIATGGPVGERYAHNDSGAMSLRALKIVDNAPPEIKTFSAFDWWLI